MLQEIQALTEIRKQKKLSFGNRFLDSSLMGIFPNDLIVVGAKTGAGKTELATQVAECNANAGKRVLFFALEAEKYEIQMRILFRNLMREYHADKSIYIPNMDYRNFYEGNLNKKADPFLALAKQKLKSQMNSLEVVYRESSFSVLDFQRILLARASEFDLVIVDHLNYFDFDDVNENKAITEIVKKIRDLALLSGLPILLLAHVRKRNPKDPIVVPEIEDFHGTSNIPKIATKAILLAPDYSSPDPKIFKTFFKVGKFRVDGSTTRYTGRCKFSIETNRYLPEFELGFFKGSEFEPITDYTQLPNWAKAKSSTDPYLTGETPF